MSDDFLRSGTGMFVEVPTEPATLDLDERQEAARRDVLEYLGESALVTAEEAEQIRREWRE